MKGFGLYYDRRKGYHKDNGRSVQSIVSVMELTKAIVAIVVQRPDDARARAGNYLRNDAEYERVFGRWSLEAGWVNVIPLATYVTCVRIVRIVQKFLRQEAREEAHFRGHEHNLRFHVAMAVACAAVGESMPSAEELGMVRVDVITDEMLREWTGEVWREYERRGATDNIAKGPDLKDDLLGIIVECFGGT